MTHADLPPHVAQLVDEARAATIRLEEARADAEAAQAERDRLVVALHDAGLSRGRIQRELGPSITESGVRFILLRARKG